MILSTSWGGDLDTFVRQAAQRGLFKTSLFVLPLLESSLERLGSAMPDGVIVGVRGDHYFLHPETKDDPKHKAFVEKFRAKTNAYPIYPVYHMVQALDGMAAGIRQGDQGQRRQVAERRAGRRGDARARVPRPDRPIKMREDGQGLEDQMLGRHEEGAGVSVPDPRQHDDGSGRDRDDAGRAEVAGVGQDAQA